jgi:hypothetical protein
MNMVNLIARKDISSQDKHLCGRLPSPSDALEPDGPVLNDLLEGAALNVGVVWRCEDGDPGRGRAEAPVATLLARSLTLVLAVVHQSDAADFQVKIA